MTDISFCCLEKENTDLMEMVKGKNAPLPLTTNIRHCASERPSYDIIEINNLKCAEMM